MAGDNVRAFYVESLCRYMVATDDLSEFESELKTSSATLRI